MKFRIEAVQLDQNVYDVCNKVREGMLTNIISGIVNITEHLSSVYPAAGEYSNPCVGIECNDRKMWFLYDGSDQSHDADFIYFWDKDPKNDNPPIGYIYNSSSGLLEALDPNETIIVSPIQAEFDGFAFGANITFEKYCRMLEDGFGLEDADPRLQALRAFKDLMAVIIDYRNGDYDSLDS